MGTPHDTPMTFPRNVVWAQAARPARASDPPPWCWFWPWRSRQRWCFFLIKHGFFLWFGWFAYYKLWFTHYKWWLFLMNNGDLAMKNDDVPIKTKDLIICLNMSTWIKSMGRAWSMLETSNSLNVADNAEQMPRAQGKEKLNIPSGQP